MAAPGRTAMDAQMIANAARASLSAMRERLEEAAAIARAADVCSEAGNLTKAVEIALDAEQLIYEAQTLLTVCGKTPRQRGNLLIHFFSANQRRGRCVGDLWIRAGCSPTSRRKQGFRRTIHCGRSARLCAMC